MAISMEQVRAALAPEEPRYNEAAKLGPEAIPLLEQLVDGNDVPLAAKAVYLAAVIGDERSEAVLMKAAQSSEPVIRVAAAGAAHNLPVEQASRMILSLVEDADFGVRKVALGSVRAGASTELLARIGELAGRHPDATLRRYAVTALERGNRASEPLGQLRAPAGWAEPGVEEPNGRGLGGGSPHAAMGGIGEGGGLVGSGGGSLLSEPTREPTRMRGTFPNGIAGTGGRASVSDFGAIPGIGMGGGSIPAADPFLGVGTGGGDVGEPGKSRE